MSKMNQKKELSEMLEHQITVLENVMDDRALFKKELEKSMKWLNDDEMVLLNEWLQAHIEVENYYLINDIIKERIES